MATLLLILIRLRFQANQTLLFWVENGVRPASLQVDALSFNFLTCCCKISQ